MDTTVKKYLFGLTIEEPRRHKNMSVFPLLTSFDGGPDYTTLKDALEKSLLSVTEVSSGGSVPELKVINAAEMAVLLLDGEELAGAKQNRVLNTTILIKEKSETVIPVSCTEQRRWSYVSKGFHDSDTVMSPKLRVEKARTVSTSLHSTGQYRSDQGTVWQKIDEQAAKAGTVSRTGAMKDTFEQKTAELDEYLRAFPYVPLQKGLLVFIGGQAVGFDFVSREKAFELLYPKLIKSYAMEAVLEDKKDESNPARELAEAFLKEAAGCEEKKYESIGRGHDFRYESGTIVGSALAVDDRVVHMAFFRVGEADKSGDMARTRHRIKFRL
jgi:ARG and Rhodanese-Phosphatase-superfamily-associated Protein domain